MRPSRRRAALTVLATVLAAHALLLGYAPTTPEPGKRGRAPAPLQVRQIVTPAEPPATEPRATPPPPTRPVLHNGPPTVRAAGAAAMARPAPAPAHEAPVNAAGSDLESAIEVRTNIAEETLPAYATRLPPAVTLHYALNHGDAAGQATLRWHTADGRYRLSLDRAVPGRPAQGSASLGDLRGSGVAPERYTESRSGRDLRAANFQHDAGRISFSGPALSHPLWPGAQDRLSWMLQLPAVLEAEPALRAAGSEVLMFVAGTRGDGEVWTFTVQGRGAVDTPAGPVTDALHLRRLPRRPYDTQIDAWLDPARHHLPVRLRLQVPPNGASTEFALERHETP